MLIRLCICMCRSARPKAHSGSYVYVFVVGWIRLGLSASTSMGLFVWRDSGGIWTVRRNAGGICERKTLFWMKKETDQARFKNTRMGPMSASWASNGVLPSAI